MIDASQAPYPSARSAWTLVAALSAINALSFVDRYLVTLLAEPLRRELRLSDTELGLLQGTAFAFVYAVLAVPFARIADSTVRRNVIAVGVALWSVMTLSVGFVRSFPALIVARMGVAGGEATLSPAAFSMLADAFPSHRLSLPTSLFAAGTAVGTSVAFLGGGWLYACLERVGPPALSLFSAFQPWQMVFFLLGAAGLIAAPLLGLLREPYRRGLDVENISGESSVDFIRRAWRLTLPLFLGFGFAGLAGNAVTSWTPILLVRKHGLSVAESGYAIGLVFLVGGLIGNGVGGWLADLLDRRGIPGAKLRVAATAIALQVVPNTLGGLATTAAGQIAAFAATVLIGGAVAGPVAAALQTVTPNRLRGTVSALFFLMYNLIGLGIGPLAVALVSDHLLSGSDRLGHALPWVTAITGPLAALLLAIAARSLATLQGTAARLP